MRRILFLFFVLSIFAFSITQVNAKSNDLQKDVAKFCAHKTDTTKVDGYLCSLVGVVQNLQNQITTLQNQIAFLKTCDAQYIDNNNGTVTDNCTGKVWQKTSTLTLYNWNDANTYCSSLNLGGYNTWRLPTEKELSGLLKFDTSDVRIYPPFAFNINDVNADLSTYNWASDTYSSNRKYDVEFTTAQTGGVQSIETIPVRCIRMP